MRFWQTRQRRIFLSTPSVRRATRTRSHYSIGVFISIHALREEGDLRPATISSTGRRFLSTPSVRRATGHDLK